MSSDASRSEDIVQDRPSRGVFIQICVKSDRDRAHSGLKGRSKMKSCSSADHNRGRFPLKRRGQPAAKMSMRLPCWEDDDR